MRLRPISVERPNPVVALLLLPVPLPLPLRLPLPPLPWRPLGALPALGPLVLLLLLLIPGFPPRGPALAAMPAPASEERMALYQKVAAVNYCVARSSGLDDAQALPLAAQTIAVLLRNEHGSRIARVGEQPLPGESLLQGSAELTLLGARQLCPAEVPAEVPAETGGETAPTTP